MPGEQTQQIFSIIRRDYGVNILSSARQFVQNSTSITKFYCHLRFNHTCLRENILPKSLKFSPPIRSSRGYKLAQKHGFDFLKLRITECHLSIKKKSQVVSKISDSLMKILSTDQWESLVKHNNKIQESVKTRTAASHQFKLSKIRPRQHSNHTSKEVWVKNLSSKKISSSQRQVLQKGLNFAVTPNSAPYADILASVEKGLKSVKNQAKVQLARCKVTQILKNSKVPPKNLSSEESRALKELQLDTSIKIMKSDKGNATVILDSHVYEKKMLKLLQNSQIYQCLPFSPNPIVATQKEVNKLVWQFAKEHKISIPVYHHLKCDKGVTPKIYGLPKIHKEAVPLRPIVSFIGSPTYRLSKYLVNILSPLFSSKYCVKNSADFAKIIRDFTLEDNDCLISFDVVSLFTSIPILDASNVIFKLLSADVNLKNRTKLTVQDIMQCLDLCFKSTIFSFKNTLYRQTFGAPMGSCVSPVVANIFMEFVEETAINTFHTPPKLWIRYVDDTFCILKRSCVDEFHEHLNSISESIQFTFEREVDGRLPFLDVHVIRHQDNTLSTTIYQKPTHTNRYLQFTSHHPKHHKLSVARSLCSRLKSHISDHNTNTESLTQTKRIQHALSINGYPKKYFQRAQTCFRSSLLSSSKPSYTSFTSLPYIQGMSDKIQRVLNEVGVKVGMKPYLTIQKLLPSLKDPLDNCEKSCLVYQVPCHDCDFVYIGQTKRDLDARLAEHKRAVKYQRPEKSALCEHSISKDHIISWSKAKILATESDYSKRIFLESWHINSKSHVMNRNDGSTFPAVYSDLLKR